MKNVKVTFPGEGRTVEVPEGTSILEAVSRAQLQIQADCGGMGTCGKCRVRVEGAVSVPADPEKGFLSDAELDEGVRLACRTAVEGAVTVRFAGPSVSSDITPFPLKFEMESGEPGNAPLSRSALELKPPGGDDRRSDLRRVIDALPEGTGVELQAVVIRDLATIIRDNSFEIYTVFDNSRLIDIAPGGTERLLGVSLDVGTTSICARLVDVERGVEICSSLSANPQRLYGADVASRINYINDEKNGLQRLRSVVVDRANEMLKYMAAETGTTVEEILKVVVAGNPTMVHVFLGIDPRAIAPAPYISPTTSLLNLPAGAVGIHAASGARVEVLPAVAAYVGADAVAAALRVRLHERKHPAIMIDLGTNAEIVLTDGEKLFACSAAAGPALEGAQIKCGMTAAAGAVDRVEIGDDVSFDTIGDASPVGLCGTGLLDAISEMLKAGIIAPNGRLCEELPDSAPEKLKDRIIVDEGDIEFALYRPGEGEGGREVVLTQKDVREFQLAKGAIRAGLEILLERAGVGVDDIGAIYLAGALGTSIRPESALRTGIVPPVSSDRIHFSGNAALDGATEALLSKSFRESTVEFSEAVEYIELSAIERFTDRFVAHMGF